MGDYLCLSGVFILAKMLFRHTSLFFFFCIYVAQVDQTKYMSKSLAVECYSTYYQKGAGFPLM